MKSYIKNKEPTLPETILGLRELNNQVWGKQILFYLLLYYKETDNNEILQIIEREKQKQRAEIETVIKKHILKWFRKNTKFKRYGFILNQEPSSEGGPQGFYDLKFQHSFWNNTESYFAFECKNLGKTKSMTCSKSISEYVYVKEKSREDGGMYRYFTGKYACEMNFGGMIGFVVGKIENPIVALIDKIYSVYDNNLVGKLTKEKIIKNSISGNHNTFDSIHLRQNIETKQDEEFWLHHILMDFTYSEK